MYCGLHLGIWKIITGMLVVFVVVTVVGVAVVGGTVAIAVGCAIGIRGMFNRGAAVMIVAVGGVVFVGVVFIVVAFAGPSDAGSTVVVVGVVAIVIGTLIVDAFGVVAGWFGAVLIIVAVRIAAGIRGFVVGADFVVDRFLTVSSDPVVDVVAEDVSLRRGCRAGGVR